MFNTCKSSIFKSDPKQCYFLTPQIHYFGYVLYIDHGSLFSKFACGLEQRRRDMLKDFNQCLKSLLR